jgi:hypothetical protein
MPLELLAPLLEELWQETVTVGPVQTVLGPVPYAGGRRPLPSSAARMQVGDHGVWLPAPEEPGDPDAGLAPLFRHAGAEYVLPTIRLFVHPQGQTEDLPPPEYLTGADWLTDALRRWRFTVLRGGASPGVVIREESTIWALLGARDSDPARRLDLVARVLWFALFGAKAAYRCHVEEGADLLIPRRPLWLRPALAGCGLPQPASLEEETLLTRKAARQLVLTARMHSGSPGGAGEGVPRLVRPARCYHIQPGSPRDWGLDPVHTPEGTDIRLTGRLGVGVRLAERRLHYPADGRPLSASTGRLPFAGYNDPRRLLMAANMQVHAVPLTHAETPLITMSPQRQQGRATSLAGAAGSDAVAPDPPGVNLRVAYLAWQGWNHEDAWVLSESAARRLHAAPEHVQTVAVRSVELPPQVLVRPGQAVERGELLVQRQAAAALLAPTLEQLARLPDVAEAVDLEPEPGDRATRAGTVVKIDTWDLLAGIGLSPDWHVPADLCGSYRLVLRIHIRRDLPLAVGDKLANRHGHKGVVGAILPEEQMPRWRGEPLDALIDPISVLNRSNWGQVYESLAGATTEAGSPLDVSALSGEQVVQRARDGSADAHGRWLIEPPAAGGWLTREVSAVAGVQFVMRLPHHACDRIAAGPVVHAADTTHLKHRQQRFGEMERWALWAHGLGGAPTEAPARLAPAALRWQRLLGLAGYDLRLAGEAVSIRRLKLEGKPPARCRAIAVADHTLPELYDALDAVTTEEPAVLVFDPPLAEVPLPGPAGEATRRQTARIRWLPLLPPEDRPATRGPDGGETAHELTLGLRAVVRAACRRLRGRHPRRRLTAEQLEGRLRQALADVLQEAYTQAVGNGPGGPSGSKWSLLRRGVLGHRLPFSGRATAAPAGTLPLDLDTVGLPRPLLRSLLGREARRWDDETLTAAVRDRWFWIKRDPLLHRWGLLPVSVRPVPGDVIRLPPGLLGPMGADFDGDTIAVFAALPGSDLAEAIHPSAVAWDEVLDRPMFVPGKQYLYGLHLLMRQRPASDALNEELQQAGAPGWPAGQTAKAALESWVRAAARREADGAWWAVVERHALAALATDPGMGLGLFPPEQIIDLEAVRCGAAKAEIYAANNSEAWRAVTRILAGGSLDLYRREDRPAEPDPIAEVMVAAKASVGLFGGALRRLLYSAARLDPADIRAAQVLTEQATQKVLSVKAGKRPIRFAEYDRHLRRLLAGEPVEVPEPGSDLHELLDRAGKSGLWERLRQALRTEPPPWVTWLREPYRLVELVADSPQQALWLPAQDLRVSSWFT